MGPCPGPSSDDGYTLTQRRRGPGRLRRFSCCPPLCSQAGDDREASGPSGRRTRRRHPQRGEWSRLG